MRIEIALVLGMLAACTPQTAVTDLSRDAARSVVRPVLADTFPGIPLEPATDCIIDNAEAGELFTLARAAATSPDASTTQTVVDIARRPATLTCFAEDGLPALLTLL
jgi:hypothetical protein